MLRFALFQDKRKSLPYLVNVQTDLSVCWLHRSYCRFYRALAHFFLFSDFLTVLLNNNKNCDFLWETIQLQRKNSYKNSHWPRILDTSIVFSCVNVFINVNGHSLLSTPTAVDNLCNCSSSGSTLWKIMDWSSFIFHGLLNGIIMAKNGDSLKNLVTFSIHW